MEKSNVGRAVAGAASALWRALRVLGPAPGEDRGSGKLYFGSLSSVIVAALARGSLGFVVAGMEGGVNEAGAGAGAAVASSFSTWMLKRSFEGAFGAEVFCSPNPARGRLGSVEVGDVARFLSDLLSPGSITSEGRVYEVVDPDFVEESETISTSSISSTVTVRGL